MHVLQVKQSVGLALFCIFLAGLPSVLGYLPLWLTVRSLPISFNFLLVQGELTPNHPRVPIWASMHKNVYLSYTIPFLVNCVKSHPI